MEKTSTSSAGQSPSLATLTPRAATQDDVGQVVEWACDFIKASPYSSVEPDRAALTTLVFQVLDVGVIFIHEGGFIAGSISPLFFAPDIRVATELAWWAPGGGGEALKVAFEEWAKDKAHAVQMSTLNTPLAPKLAERLTSNGYTPVEVAYMKVF